jgi:putative membrane protein
MSNLGLFIRGFAMGVSDSVPGVSGGTIALMTGVYERLILSLQAFDIAFFLLMLRGEFKTAWVKIDGGFLSMLGVGIIVGVISSANSILFILSNFSEPLMGFFIG